MARRTKWKGWVQVEDVDPELMARFRQYRERYRYYRAHLSCSDFGTGNSWEAHQHASGDVPLTHDEQDIMKRLQPSDWDRE